MVKLEFYDPSGTMEIAQSHAPRLASLEGKRIGIVSNDQWQAYRMLPMIKGWLEEDFAGADLTPLQGRRHEFYDGLTRWTPDSA